MARDYKVSKGIVDSDQYVYREERDLTKTDVDWAAVSKTLVTDIEKMRDVRETTKADIETKTRKQMAEFDKLEQYANETLNVTMLKGANQAKEFLMTQNRLMKRGFGTTADYQVSKQTVADNFTQIKKVTENADKVFQDLMKRTNSQVPGEQNNIFERMLGELNAGFTEMAGQDLVINPQTGNMSFVKKNLTDEEKKNPDNHMSIAGLDQRMSQQADYVSLTKDATAQVEALADVINVKYITENQGVKTIEDWYALDGTKEMLSSMVDTVTSSDAQVMSILQDSGYTKDNFTTSQAEADKDPKKIFYSPDPSGSGLFKFDLTPAQQKIVDDKAEAAIRSMINRKEDFQKGFADQQATSTTIGAGDRERRAGGLYEEVVKMVTGNVAASGASSTALAAIVNDNLGEGDPRITNIERSEDGKSFIVTRSEGNPFVIEVDADDDTSKSTTEIIKELFQELNPYSNIDIVLAQDSYDGEVPDIVGVGGAKGNVRSQKIKPVNITSKIKVDGELVGLSSYIDSEFDGDFTNWFGGQNWTPKEVTPPFDMVINNLVNKELKSSIANSGGEYGIVWKAEDKYVQQPMYVVIGGSEKEIDNWWTLTSSDLVDMITDTVTKETNRVNKAKATGGGMSSF